MIEPFTQSDRISIGGTASITELVIDLHELRKSVNQVSSEISELGKELAEYYAHNSNFSIYNEYLYKLFDYCSELEDDINNSEFVPEPSKITIVLGTRYDPNYGSIFNNQSNGVANTLFRDSIRIEMLAEILGKEYCVKSMNDQAVDNEFHISACFGRRAANCERMSEFKNVSSYFLLD
jgi:regulator of replication initiation timing